MKGTIITVIVIIIIIAIGFIFLGGNDNSSPTANDSGAGATKNLDSSPEFSLEDYDGNSVSDTDFEGKVLVLNAWATWCPFCVNELPDFVELQKELGDQIVVVAIDRQESLSKSKSFTDELGITDDLLFLLDPDDSFYRSIGGFSMPETIFVNASGEITFHKRGPMPLGEMRTLTQEALDS